MFFFKKKQLHIDFFTCRSEVYEYAPIDQANKFIPRWWKDLPKPSNNSTSVNMRYCSGFNDLYKCGVVVPLWSDLNIAIGAQGTQNEGYQYSDKTSTADFHSVGQRGGFSPDSLHMKLVNPWIARCSEDVHWISIGTQYNQQSLSDYALVNGILEFKYQPTLNINLMFERHAADRTFFIEHGTPLMQLIPLDERRVVHHNHLVSIDEIIRLERKSTRITFQAKYYKVLQLAKNKESKCPFTGSKV
jgi:hypothetical protein